MPMAMRIDSIDGEVGALDLTDDVGMLGNGAYMLHALAVDEFDNVQTDESPQTTVNVLNFRVADVTRLRVTAVDDVDVPRTPPEPIPLRSSLTVGFDVDKRFIGCRRTQWFCSLEMKCQAKVKKIQKTPSH